MNSIKEWYAALPKREQYLLMFCAAVVLVYLIYIQGYQKLIKEKQRYQQLNQHSQETLLWVRQAVKEIEQSRNQGSGAAKQAANSSLAQIAEKAAGRAGIRVNRFSPAGDNEAQVWFERVEFEKFLVCLSALELDYLVQVESLAVNAVNAPGLVNARLKITR